MKLDAVMILGKEFRRDPERAGRELRARAAAASIALRQGATWVATVEARMRGQERSGSSMVIEYLTELGVPADRIIAKDLSRSTREEAIFASQLLQDRVVGRLGVFTASYHVPRARRYFTQVLYPGRFEVLAPEEMLNDATDLERSWIEAGIPTGDALRAERKAERTLTLLGEAASILPRGWTLEMRAAALLRRT